MRRRRYLERHGDVLGQQVHVPEATGMKLLTRIGGGELALGLVAAVGSTILALLVAGGLLSGRPAPARRDEAAGRSIQPAPDAGARVGLIQPPPGAGPFLRGVKVTLAQAQADVPYALSRPASPLASDDSIAAVWVESGPGFSHAAIDYTSGIEEIIQPAEFTDPSKKFEAIRSELSGDIGSAVSVQTVQGGPALVIDQNAQGTNAGSVSFVTHNLLVQIYGHYPEGTLMSIAETVR